MNAPLTKLQFKPGINRETTSYSNEGGWFDVDKVRFRFGYPEKKIGGWSKYSSTAFLGTCQGIAPVVRVRRHEFYWCWNAPKVLHTRGNAILRHYSFG